MLEKLFTTIANMALLLRLIHWLVVWCVCRGRTQEERGCAGALSGRSQSFGDGHCRISHVLDVAVSRRRLRISASSAPEHRSQLQLHGSAGWLRSDAQICAPALYLLVSRFVAVESLWQLSTPSEDLFLFADRRRRCICRLLERSNSIQ